MKTHLIKWLSFLCLLCSCTPQTAPDSDSSYTPLLGTWRAASDSSLVLVLSQACCGNRSTLAGTLRHGSAQGSLNPASYVNMYPVQKPDSAATAYLFTMFLTLQTAPFCSADGYVQDGKGQDQFPSAMLPTSVSLSLKLSSGAKCDSTLAPIVFTKNP